MLLSQKEYVHFAFSLVAYGDMELAQSRFNILMEFEKRISKLKRQLRI